jgi:hypothetical protein
MLFEGVTMQKVFQLLLSLNTALYLLSGFAEAMGKEDSAGSSHTKAKSASSAATVASSRSPGSGSGPGVEAHGPLSAHKTPSKPAKAGAPPGATAAQPTSAAAAAAALHPGAAAAGNASASVGVGVGPRTITGDDVQKIAQWLPGPDAKDDRYKTGVKWFRKGSTEAEVAHANIVAATAFKESLEAITGSASNVPGSACSEFYLGWMHLSERTGKDLQPDARIQAGCEHMGRALLHIKDLNNFKQAVSLLRKYFSEHPGVTPGQQFFEKWISGYEGSQAAKK